MTITDVDIYRDGGTISITTKEHGEVCVDNRIRTTTRGSVWLGYPGEGTRASSRQVWSLMEALMAAETLPQEVTKLTPAYVIDAIRPNGSEANLGGWSPDEAEVLAGWESNRQQKARRRNVAMAIVTRLEDDITGRKGLGAEWEVMESGTRANLRDTWVDLIVEELERP